MKVKHERRRIISFPVGSSFDGAVLPKGAKSQNAHLEPRLRPSDSSALVQRRRRHPGFKGTGVGLQFWLTGVPAGRQSLTFASSSGSALA